MCLAIPMKLVKIDGEEGIVDSGGLRRKVNISLVRDVRIGDYVLIHAGFAIEKIHRDQASETLKAIKAIHEIR